MSTRIGDYVHVCVQYIYTSKYMGACSNVRAQVTLHVGSEYSPSTFGVLPLTG